jgi:hypothetical protein
VFIGASFGRAGLHFFAIPGSIFLPNPVVNVWRGTHSPARVVGHGVAVGRRLPTAPLLAAFARSGNTINFTTYETERTHL